MAGEAAPMEDGVLFQLRESIWNGLEGDDVGRWFRQEFRYSANEGTTFGLRQRSGGPCGVLAAVQGYILAKLLFGCSLCELRDVVEKGSAATLAASTDPSKMLAPSAEALTGALSHALTFVCWQAGDMKGCRIVMAADEAALPLGVDTPAAALTVFTFDDFAEAEAFLCSILPQFETPSGVALLMYSVLLSRGLERVRADADEPTPLVARFGHCSQELLNLLLTGEATSGIFDGVQSLGGEDMGMLAGDAGAATGGAAPAPDVLCLKGISRRPLIGYLSHVEAMRYGKVGEYYKSPLVPVWVVGSESHFSLLFGSDPAVNEESPSAGVYRAFKKYDAHDNQFIPVDKFPAVLADLALPLAADKTKAAAVGKQLDTGSMGFIVWSDFWMAVSQMQAGVAPDAAVAAVRAVHGLTTSGSGSGAGAGAGAAAGAGSAAGAPTASAAPYSGPPMSFEDLTSLLRASFEQHDDMEAGFVLASKLPSVIHTAVPHLPHGFKLTDAEIGQLAGRLTVGQDPAQAIILFDDLLREATPLLKRLATASAKPAPAPAPVAAAPVAGAGGASAAAAPAAGPAVGSKRPRSDSDVARELQRQMDDEASAAAVRGAGSGSAAHPPLVPVPPSSPSGASTTAVAGEAPDVMVLDAAGSVVSGSAAAAGAGGAATGAGAGGAAAGAGADAGAAPEGAAGGDKVRRFHLYHYNGLEDGGRRPRCVKLTVKQSDSGLAPVSAHQDAITAHGLARGTSVSGAGAGSSGAAGGSSSGAGGSIEDDMAAALALSVMEADAAEAAAIAASMETATAMPIDDASGSTAATSASATAPVDAASVSAAAAAPASAAGETVDSADAAAIAAVHKADKAAAAGVGPLEGIIRTKWPAAAVSCEGPPPSID